jgi:hypothetical protein
MTLSVVGGNDVERSYAFRPSTLEKDGIHVWFRRKPTVRFSWKKFRFVPATLVTEIWTSESDESFEPGNCWIEEEKSV